MRRGGNEGALERDTHDAITVRAVDDHRLVPRLVAARLHVNAVRPGYERDGGVWFDCAPIDGHPRIGNRGPRRVDEDVYKRQWSYRARR